MASVIWALWLVLGAWGVVIGWRAGRVVVYQSPSQSSQKTASSQNPPTPAPSPPLSRGERVGVRGDSTPAHSRTLVAQLRLRWLGDGRGWALALSVASFAPALAPDASLPLQAALTVLAGAGLLRLMHALDSRAVGQGVVAGLGLIALVLDSLSGSAWARLGALGHGAEVHGVGLLYGTLALLWGLLVVRAWQRIEGNPLGAVVGLGALACWLGWAGLTPAVGWGAAATALALGLGLLRRERDERKRVRLMLQNRIVRIVRRASNADLVLAAGALVGLCLLALGLSGAPIPEMPRLGTHAILQAGVLATALVGLWKRFALTPSPSPTRWERGVKFPLSHKWGRGIKGVRATPNHAALTGVALLTLLGGEPLATLALGTLILWASHDENLQEYPTRASNPPNRTGGSE